MTFHNTKRGVSGLMSMISGAALLLGSLLAQPASAQTVESLTAAKTIKIGVLVDFPPFGIMNSAQQPDGFDIELAKKMAAAMGVTPEITPVSNANRIPYLQSGRLDVLVASLGITPERATQVLFTLPYAATSVVVAGPKTLKVASKDELADKRIAVGRGGSPDIYFTKNPVSGASMLKFDGEAGAFQAVMTGQADVFSTSNITVASLIEANPSASIEQKITLTTQANAMAVRKDATDLQAWLNKYIASVRESGELGALYKKWVKAPMPTLPQQ